MFLDKDGKLFGKINIIDFLALLLLAAAAIFLVTRFLVPKTGETPFVLEFFAEEAETWVVESMQEGDMAEDGTEERVLGAVSEMEMRKAEKWVSTEEGAYIKIDRPGFSALSVLVETRGETHINGVSVGGHRYFVGDTVFLRIGDATLPMRLRNIRVPEKG